MNDQSVVDQVLLIDRTTVRRYYRDYKKGGVTRLRETHSEAVRE